ncbi:hypothetical protein BH10PLA1_BH10PLA1_22700 [soil metagenome]
MKETILCQVCGVEAPTKYVEFHQNIGMLVMRRSQSLKGCLCKSCVHSNFWKMTGTTLAVGWLGTISVVIAPFFVLNNLIRYVGVLGMPAVPEGAGKPVVGDAEIVRLYPIAGTVISRVNAGEPITKVARELAPSVNVTPGQLLTYVAALARSGQITQTPQSRPTGGFPVMPASQASAQQAPPPLPMSPAMQRPAVASPGDALGPMA